MSHERVPPWVVAVAIAVTIAGIVYGPHLLDLGVPVEGDVRAHIFKIGVLHQYLSVGSWPVWAPEWYEGFPLFQYYPPAFYVVGAALTFVTGHAVVSYKILMLLALAANGMAMYFFSRRLLQFPVTLAIAALTAYECSTGVLVNCLYGVGPNLLGWSVGVAFLTVYSCGFLRGVLSKANNRIRAGLLLGLTLLIHPFPVVFIALSTVTLYLIWFIRERPGASSVLARAKDLLAIAAIGAAISIYYWLPFVATRDYVSPIYTTTESAWPGGTAYLLVAFVPALLAGALIRFRDRESEAIDYLLAFFLLSAGLGFGLARYLPFGLGSLVHEFRFVTMMAPFFAICLLLLPAKYALCRLTIRRLAWALVFGMAVAASLFASSDQHVIRVYLELAAKQLADVDLLYVARIAARQIQPFAIAILPVSWIAFLAFSTAATPAISGRTSNRLMIASTVATLVLVAILPFHVTHLDRLFTYVENYRSSDYQEIVENIGRDRVVIPIEEGYLTEGDSLITYAWLYGIETVNGAYNQGDPKFFLHTVHLEWEERWLDYMSSRQNLMQECAARFIFVRGERSGPFDTSGLLTTCANEYGRLLALQEPVSRAVNVTPILLDAENPATVTRIFNILMPHGYRLVFVPADDVPLELQAAFKWVFVDQSSKAAKYGPEKNIVVLGDSGDSDVSVTEDGDVPVAISVPLQDWTEQWFYTGDAADTAKWSLFDLRLRSHGDQLRLPSFAAAMPFLREFAESLDYEAATYTRGVNKVEVGGTPGFILVKDSWYPWWNSDEGDLLRTTQGFMLAYSQDGHIRLEYGKPLAVKLAAIASVGTMCGAGVALALTSIRKRRSHRLPSRLS